MEILKIPARAFPQEFRRLAGKSGDLFRVVLRAQLIPRRQTSRDLSAVSVEAGRTRRPPNQRTEVGFGSKGLGRRVILDILASWSLLARRLLKGDRPIFLTDHLPEVSCLPIEKERVLHLAAAARMRCGIDDRKPVTVS